ncbi:hypothetical protein D3C78_1451650 [compost metagenome]
MKGELIEVLEYLSQGEPWQNHMIGFELPEHFDEDDSNKDGIMLFMQTYKYIEINIDNLKFYNCLKEICDEYLIENPGTKEVIHSLMIKAKEILEM